MKKSLHFATIEWLAKKIQGKITHGISKISEAYPIGNKIPDLIEEKPKRVTTIHEVETLNIKDKVKIYSRQPPKEKRVLWIVLPENTEYAFNCTYVLQPSNNDFQVFKLTKTQFNDYRKIQRKFHTTKYDQLLKRTQTKYL